MRRATKDRLWILGIVGVVALVGMFGANWHVVTWQQGFLADEFSIDSVRPGDGEGDLKAHWGSPLLRQPDAGGFALAFGGGRSATVRDDGCVVSVTGTRLLYGGKQFWSEGVTGRAVVKCLGRPPLAYDLDTNPPRSITWLPTDADFAACSEKVQLWRVRYPEYRLDVTLRSTHPSCLFFEAVAFTLEE